jgi:hypothetical protein
MAWDITQIQTDAPAGRDSLLHVAALRLEVVACIPRLRHNRSFEFGWGMGGLYSAYRVHRARPREPAVVGCGRPLFWRAASEALSLRAA